MAINLYPSPVVKAFSHWTIRECLEKMTSFGVGSILVVDHHKDRTDEVLGIFTERDLLKNFGILQKGAAMSRNITTLMTKNVHCLSVQEIDKAGQLMVQKGVRHVPITQDNRVVGMVGMRDLFRDAFREPGVKTFGEVIAKNENIQGEVSFLSHDLPLLRLLEYGFSSYPKISLNRLAYDRCLPPNGSASEYESAKVLIFDLDGVEQDEWATFLRLVNYDDDSPPTVILVDPKDQSEKSLEILNQIGSGSARFSVFYKPVDAFTLFKVILPFLKAQ